MNLGMSIGDPCGIGPEVLLQALQAPLPHGVSPVIFGPLEILEREDARLQSLRPEYRRARLVTLQTPDALVPPGTIGVIEVAGDLDLCGLPTGAPDARAATVQYEAFLAAVQAARLGQTLGVVTAPWNKANFRLTDQPATGHTELLAKLFDAPHHVMMLAGPRLRVSLVTVHVPLADVSAHVTSERLWHTIETTARDLRRLYGVTAPTIAVCGLNPHAGEHGVMGMEEGSVISPVLERAREELVDVTLVGPLPSDTLFAKFGGGRAPFDAVICMYHDQGLIPLKLVHFGESANVTLGLPIVRTSVDHGTAYDIAGQGIADSGSMRYAMLEAIRMSRHLITEP